MRDQFPSWHDFAPRNLYLRVQERPVDKILADRNLLQEGLQGAADRLLSRANQLKADLEIAVGWKHRNIIEDVLGDVGMEIQQISDAPRRLEWALFLAAHSAFEVELVEMAYGDAAARKYSTDAVHAMRDQLARVVSDVDDLEKAVRLLKALRDEFAHGGGRLRSASPHQESVDLFIHDGFLEVQPDDGEQFITFAKNGFDSLMNMMNKVIWVARASAAK